MFVNTLKRLARALGYNITRFPHGCEILQAHLRMLLPRLDVDCVVDVGANSGQYGQMLRSIGYAGRIISFEPVSSCYQKLAQVAARDGNWETFQLALGEADAVLPINVTSSTDFSSFLTPNEYCSSTFGEGPRVAHVEQVPVRRLDDVLDDLPQITGHSRLYLKMDTQGFDQAVLRGAADCMDRIVALQSELSVKPVYGGAVRYLDALREFEEAGFEVSGLFPVNRDRNLRLVEVDCVMVRESWVQPNSAGNVLCAAGDLVSASRIV